MIIKHLFISTIIVSGLMAEGGWYENTLDILEKTKEITISTIEKAKEIIEIEKENIEKDKGHLSSVWSEVLENLDDGVKIQDKMKILPEKKFFGEDKRSAKKDLDKVLDEVISLLIDENIMSYRENIDNTQNEIANSKKEILESREKKISAPIKSLTSTTKSDYDTKIIELKIKVKILEAQIETLKIKLSQQLKDVGINLSVEQIDVLTSRVDGDDIIKISLVMDILKEVTAQLVDLMQDSGEELAYAKKYYGMHVVLLEMVVYMQEIYISKVENNYIPKIKDIISKAKILKSQTKANLRDASEELRKNIYKTNIEAQNLTIKTANLYLKNLDSQKRKIKEATIIVKKDLKVSKNTYDTVTISADLVSLLNENSAVFNKLISIQVPDIVPFENLQMKKKYNELTKIIK